MSNDKNVTWYFSREALRRYVGGYGVKSLLRRFSFFWKHMNKAVDKRIIYLHENYDQNVKILC